MHSLLTELYYELALVYALKVDALHTHKKSAKSEEKILFQYTQSAYIESMRSSVLYDHSARPNFLHLLTNINPDTEKKGCYVPPGELLKALGVISQ